MNLTQQKNLQQQVSDYFKDVDNETFVAFVESMVYEVPAKNDKISELSTKFLEDNGLTVAYVNYVSDLRDDSHRLFNRSSFSERDMIESIKNALLSVSFNRFRKVAHIGRKDTRYENLKAKQDIIIKILDQLLDAGSTERYHEAMDELVDMKRKGNLK